MLAPLETNTQFLGNVDFSQLRSQPKIFFGEKYFGAKMFDFKRATVFLFGTPLLKAKDD